MLQLGSRKFVRGSTVQTTALAAQGKGDQVDCLVHKNQGKPKRL
jgi:hypothetical protein